MRIFHYLAGLVWKLDVWILDRFQYLANLAYTRWETSPYAIAAKCFHGAGACAIVGFGLLMTGVIGDEADFTPAIYVLLFLFLVAVFFESTWAHKKHLRWKAHKFTNTPGDERYPFLRLVWVWMVVHGLLIIIVSILSHDLELRNWFGLGIDVGFMSGFYFLSCAPPTRLEKKQEQHTKDLVPHFG